MDLHNVDPITVALQATLDNRQRLLALEHRTKCLDARVTSITSDSGNYTVKAYARLHDIVGLDRRQALKLGKCASELCRLRGFKPGRSRDETFGYVNNYPEEILKEVFAEFEITRCL
jgi:hypothetical protein